MLQAENTKKNKADGETKGEADGEAEKNTAKAEATSEATSKIKCEVDGEAEKNTAKAEATSEATSKAKCEVDGEAQSTANPVSKPLPAKKASSSRSKPLAHKLHGVLLVRKEAGCTSHNIVSSIRKILNQKEVGHSGTLDPIACGLMLILLGYGTKISDYLLTGDKSYSFVFRLGLATDTLDITGKVLSEKKVHLSDSVIKQHLQRHEGKLHLPVPLFSAVKVKGKKLYQYMREGLQVTAPKREMHFYNLQVKWIKDELVAVELSCSKGSYIRSWVAAVGEALGVGACLKSLTRTGSKPFSLQPALSVKEIQTRVSKLQSNNVSLQTDTLQQMLLPAFIPLAEALPHIEQVVVSGQDERSMRYGRVPVNVLMSLKSQQKRVNIEKTEQVICVMNAQKNRLLALLQLRVFKSPKILRVFPVLA